VGAAAMDLLDCQLQHSVFGPLAKAHGSISADAYGALAPPRPGSAGKRLILWSSLVGVVF
jgi:hypothetical protein